MKNSVLLIVFAAFCLACLTGVGFVLFDAVATASGSSVQGLGAAAVFVMLVLFAARQLWHSRTR